MEITTVLAMAEMATAQLKEVEVKSEQDLMDAVTFLGRAKTAIDQVEALRLAFTGPLEKHIRSINVIFRDISVPIKDAYAMVKGKTEDWKRAETVRIAEQERINREAAEATNDEIRAIIQQPESPIKRVFAPDGNAQFRKVWKFEVTNEIEVPRQFLMVDMAKVRAAVNGGIREIPGVRIYEDEQLAVSGHPVSPIPAAEWK